MRFPWEPDDQSQENNLTSLRHRSGTAFFPEGKGSLKIDRSVKMPRHRLSMEVVRSKQEKMRGQRGSLRALAGICHVHESYF